MTLELEKRRKILKRNILLRYKKRKKNHLVDTLCRIQAYLSRKCVKMMNTILQIWQIWCKWSTDVYDTT